MMMEVMPKSGKQAIGRDIDPDVSITDECSAFADVEHIILNMADRFDRR